MNEFILVNSISMNDNAKMSDKEIINFGISWSFMQRVWIAVSMINGEGIGEGGILSIKCEKSR